MPKVTRAPKSFKKTPARDGRVSSSRWVLTANSPDDIDDDTWKSTCTCIDDIQQLYDAGEIVYAVGQFERGGEKHRLHLQSFVVLKTPRRRIWMSSRLPRQHCKEARATVEDDERMRRYCCNPNKDGFDSHAFECGTWPDSIRDSTVDQRGTSKITEMYQKINDGAITKTEDLLTEYAPQYFQRGRELELYIDKRVAHRDLEEYHSTRPDQYVPKVWQHYLRQYLTEAPREDRKVLFVCDSAGHGGKSRFIQEMLRLDSPGFSVSNLCPSALRDMADAYPTRGCNVLLIDITRSKQEFAGHVYDFTENLKSGTVFSPKFSSFSKLFAPPHIVIMTNDPMPDFGRSTFNNAHGSGRDFMVEADPSNKKPPPFTYDRYVWWELGDDFPGLSETYDSDSHPWFPPFKRLCKDYETTYEWVPDMYVMPEEEE